MTEVISRILVPVDFSEHSDRALRYAMRIASQFGATLELFHVVEDPSMSGAWGPEMYVPNMQELLRTLIADAREHLDTARASVKDPRVAVETRVVTGSPVRSIIEQTATGHFDLIVMGTHGRTGLSHAVMGSVAERVVRQAPCPVLTVKDTPANTQEAAGLAAA
jgi:nucleotide-binding universal stress UspA family protein